MRWLWRVANGFHRSIKRINYKRHQHMPRQCIWQHKNVWNERLNSSRFQRVVSMPRIVKWVSASSADEMMCTKWWADCYIVAAWNMKFILPRIERLMLSWTGDYCFISKRWFFNNLFTNDPWVCSLRCRWGWTAFALLGSTITCLSFYQKSISPEAKSLEFT